MNRKEKTLEFAEVGYNFQITGRHVEVTDAMKDYAIEKISKLERFMNRIIEVNVIMDIQKLDHRVEIILKAGNFKIVSQSVTTDMYVSIDTAVHKLETQLLRYKSKIQNHHAKKHVDLDMTVNVINRSEMEDFTEIDEMDNSYTRFKPHRVVKQKTIPLKTLTYDEAVMKMELSDDAFMIFKNEEDLKLKIIYRRKDDNYGIIEPSC